MLFKYVEVILFGVLISIIGQIGDFAESMLKRFADVKDSGNILPGHGVYFRPALTASSWRRRFRPLFTHFILIKEQ